MNANPAPRPASASLTKLLCQCLAVMTLTGQLVLAASPGTGFTYQGRLFIGDVPANGLYDLQFTNYDAAAGGNALGGFNTNALPVTNGLFTVTLDFGAVFDGTPRWLEISERTNGVGAFGTLAPRQWLAAAPYATFAASAGTVPGLTILQNADGAPNVVGGAPVNWVAGGVEGATIAGGGAANYVGSSAYTNSVSADFGTIGGGDRNTIEGNADRATIAGGENNAIETFSDRATIGGGANNLIQTQAKFATVGGGRGNLINTNAEFATIGGGEDNQIDHDAGCATIGGGGDSTGGPGGNRIGANSISATIGGGSANVILTNTEYSTIGGGVGNNIGSYVGNSIIGGGRNNTIQASVTYATIGGGRDNAIQANATYATIGGGSRNTILANASYATVPGGVDNSATSNAFAAGTFAQAIHTGAFVWADSTPSSFSSTANDQFAVRANGGALFQLGGANATVQADDTSTYSDAKQLVIQGNANSSRQLELGYKTDDGANYGTIQAVEQNKGFRSLVLQPSGGNVGIGTTSPGNLLVVGGSGSPAYCNGTSWVNGSDRNSKEAFTAINPRAVLEKVSALPITEWRYKVEADGTEHLGPMAQDFHAAFGLNGPDDKHIATVDEEGVALAAIQGLNQKLEETRADNAALREDNADLKARLEKLERLMESSK